MTYETIEQIKQSIRKLDKQIDEAHAERLAAGKPSDPPSKFVPLPLAWTIYERLSPLIRYAVEYANLCDKSNEIIDISDDQMSWIKSYELDVLFINNSEISLGLVALGIDGIYKVLTEYEEYETAGELIRELVRYITMTRPIYNKRHNVDSFIYDHRASKEENEAAYREANKEIERLKDDDYFQQEYDKLLEYYETIKEDF